MKRTLLYIIVSVCLSCPVLLGASMAYPVAEGNGTAFHDGNEYYEEKEYDKAIEKYRSILANGYENGELYYNLGTAYLQKGEIGRSILNYERALYLMPRDSDLKANYARALSMMKRPDPFSGNFTGFLGIERVFSGLSLKEHIMVSLALLYVTAVYIALTVIFGRYRKFHVFFISVGLITTIAAMSAFLLKWRDKRSSAIVIEKVIDARYEPAADGKPRFPLYEGMKIGIIRESDGWYKIRRSDGKIGWVNADKVLPVTPNRSRDITYYK